MTRETALEWARMLVAIGDPQTTIEQIACVILATEAQTAARCAEIVMESLRHYGDEPCTLTMRVGLDCIREQIRSEFPAVARADGETNAE